MFNLINIQIVDINQIEERLNKKFFKELEMILGDELNCGCNDDTLIKVDRFISQLKSTVKNIEEFGFCNDDDYESENEKAEKKELKEIKTQVKNLIEELKELPASIVIALGK